MNAAAARPWRVWVALFAPPFLLAIAFFPLVARLGTDRAALTPVAPYAVVVGFGVSLALTLLLARKDGVAVGWTKPRGVDVLLALVVAAAVAALYPALRAADPTFDPTLPGVPLPLAVASLGVAIVAEDALYRGYGHVVLRARHGLAFAVVVTTIAQLTATPAPSIAFAAWAALLGVALSLLRARSGSLWPVVVAHAVVALGPKLVG